MRELISYMYDPAGLNSNQKANLVNTLNLFTRGHTRVEGSHYPPELSAPTSNRIRVKYEIEFPDLNDIRPRYETLKFYTKTAKSTAVSAHRFMDWNDPNLTMQLLLLKQNVVSRAVNRLSECMLADGDFYREHMSLPERGAMLDKAMRQYALALRCLGESE